MTNVRSKATTQEQQLRIRLGELVKTLEQIESTVTVAAAALRHQNCERDVDVARVLQRGVADRVSVEIEKIATWLASLKPRSARARK